MSDCIILRTLSCCSHKFSTRCRAQVPCTLFFFLSIRSCTDSFRSLSQCFSSSFRAHPDFISRAMISPLDFLRAIIFLPYSAPLSSVVSPAASSRALQPASDLTLSSYVPPILHPRHLSPIHPTLFFCPRARVSFLSVRRTLESHKALRRIFHAAISTGRDERRHSSRRPIQSEKWRDLVLNGVRTKFPSPLIRRSW